MELDTHAIPLQPSFWIVVLAAGVQPIPINEGGMTIANVEFYQSRCVAYTKAEAIKSVLNQLQAEQPQLWQHGQKLGGWKVTHVDGISGEDMQKMFKERADRERATEADKRRMEKNEFLQRILTTKDIALLHKAIREGAVTEYERAYLHEKLTADMPKEIAELHKSPYML